MILSVSILLGVGLVLVLLGVTAPRGANLSRRVEPYLGGLKGRPSSLLTRPRRKREGLLRRVVGTISLSDDDALEGRLAAAGTDIDVADFRFEQITWAMFGLLTVAAFGSLAWGGLGLDLRTLPVLAAIALVTGFLARDWALSRRIGMRRRRIVEELPVALDLLTLSIMSGESVAGACARVAGALGDGAGDEFRSVVADIRAGCSTVDSLEGLARRIPDPAASRLVDALCTAIERGAPLADVLRAQAEDIREARRRSLLEMGGRREVLMLVPVVFLILPTVVVFALFPGLVSLELLVP